MVDASGNNLLTEGSRVRKIRPDGLVTTVAGSPQEGLAAAGYADGRGLEAAFNAAAGLAMLPDGTIAVVDSQNQRVRLVEVDETGSTIAGRGGQGLATGPETRRDSASPWASPHSRMARSRSATTTWAASSG